MMRFFKHSILVCLLVFMYINPPARAAGDIGVELVRLKTTDGIPLTGVMRTPHKAPKNAGVVMIHGYSGNFYSGIMGFLPEALADQGFTTLALNMRDHDRGPKKNRFEDNRHDIAAAVHKMAQLGYNSIFLYGHSMGTNRVLYYLAKTGDPRINGVLLTGPPGNLFEWNIHIFGIETATRVLRQAQDLMAKGKGGQWMLIDLGPLGKALYTAEHVVSLRGPDTVSDPYRNIARISKPAFIVHGLADRLANPDIADRLRSSGTSASEVTVLKIPDANHRFSNHQETLANVLSRWMIEQINP
ncbi:MAG: alpha/beta fold hydrolase [Deltaproteobacteria bacterium]|nr:alpha/beta fold hydrolase [Deltaproteobacteria bacterium]MBW1825687.1 alpha/beta fold hydrolase [Deltaproteobacteria bacterium]MBW1967972.1 alpha/beta fold hydrolase [Deltaproteobacteria bacterium]MBW2196958.1 alpha/beta fold hydrolase [Deltaproteobacteria bacterium]MBW2225785.1 alpha/beta fold hydrolase [Deltaproteobacteria bacterium]